MLASYSALTLIDSAQDILPTSPFCICDTTCDITGPVVGGVVAAVLLMVVGVVTVVITHLILKHKKERSM